MTANRLLLEAKHVAQVANLRARILGNGLFPFTPEPSALNENDFVLWICSKRVGNGLFPFTPKPSALNENDFVLWICNKRVGNSLYKRCHPEPPHVCKGYTAQNAYKTMRLRSRKAKDLASTTARSFAHLGPSSSRRVALVFVVPQQESDGSG